MTFGEWIKPLPGLKLEVVPALDNPSMRGDDQKWEADHWQCKLTNGKGQVMVFHFSKGIGLRKNGRPVPPKLNEVLDSLASDANGVETASHFEDWASEYGYDIDSRKAEKTYRVCVEQAKQLQQVLGEVAYKALLFEVERL